jgi:XapX domain-containing protein
LAIRTVLQLVVFFSSRMCFKSQEGVAMKLYLISFAVGVLVGVIYGLLSVRSPAPPVIALVGLAGILVGEQAVPMAKQWFAKQPINSAAVSSHLRSHSFGKLPTQSSDFALAVVNEKNNDEQLGVAGRRDSSHVSDR